MKLNTPSLMITEELITYPTAQLAKQAGFNLPTVRYFCGEVSTANFEEMYHPEYVAIEEDTLLEYWNDGWIVNKKDNSRCCGCKVDNINYFEACSQPTQSLLQRWIREVHNIDTEARPIRYIGDEQVSYYQEYLQGCTINMKRYATYELALEQALQEALTIIINRKETNNGI